MDVIIVPLPEANTIAVESALRMLGATPRVSGSPADAAASTGVILAGHCSPARAWTHLQNAGLLNVLRQRSIDGHPLLMIGSAFQLLFDTVVDGDTFDGLGLVPGHAHPLTDLKHIRESQRELLPGPGWADMHCRHRHALFEGLFPVFNAYVSRLVAVEGIAAADQIATTPLATSLPAVVQRGCVTGTQFRPEKSGDSGLLFLRNWLNQLCTW